MFRIFRSFHTVKNCSSAPHTGIDLVMKYTKFVIELSITITFVKLKLHKKSGSVSISINVLFIFNIYINLNLLQVI